MIKEWLVAIALLLSFNASATETEGVFYLCNWCETRSDFINVAESNGQSLPVNQEADYEVIVVNDMDGVLYKGRLLVENWNGTIHTTARLFLGSADLHAAYNDFKEFHAEAAAGNIVITMPPPTWTPEGGGLSFNQHERYMVNDQITAHPLYMDLVDEHFPMPGNGPIELLWDTMSIYMFGDYPRVIVVFENGDVAMFEITAPLHGDAVAAQYVPGTARNKYGNAIPDGSGTVTGGSYVQVGPGGGLRIRASDDYVWVICTRTGDGPWTCYVDEDDTSDQ